MRLVRGAGVRARTGMLREGLRARARLHAAVLAAAALVVAAAVVGAVFAGAAQESIVRDTLADAGAGGAGLHLVARISADSPLYPPSDFDRVLAETPAGGRFPSFPRRIPVLTMSSSIEADGSDVGPEPTRIAYRAGVCAHLRIIAGRCPEREGEALVSRKTVVDGGGWRVGRGFSAKNTGPLVVVGVYRPIAEDDPYWFGVNYFDGGVRGEPGGDTVLTADTVFVTSRQFTDRVSVNVDAAVDYPLDPDAIVIGDGTGLRREVAQVRRSLSDTPFELQTSLTDALRQGLAQRGYVERGADLVALQLVLLGTVVLFFIVLDLTQGRRREIALAKLRGQTGAAVARFALAEPLVVLLAALPVGVVLGWLAGVVLGALVLRSGTPVLLPPSALGAAGIALLGAGAAAVLSTARVLARPVLEQWSDAERAQSRASRVLQVVAALAALAAAVLLLVGGTAGAPTAVLVPALLLVVAALIGVPLLVALARRLAPRSRATARIARFLVVRQLARSTAARRTAALLVVTLGLAVFAVGGQSVLAGNRAARAEAEVGADRVLSVAPDGGVDPVAAVEAADPDRRWAMAAATWLPDGGESVGGVVVGLDPSRLAAVGAPVRGGPSPRALAGLIDAAGVPELSLRGDRLTADLAVSALRGDRPPEVLLVVRTAAGALVRAQAGALRIGRHDYTARVPCTRGCTFSGFVWTRPVLAEQAVGATVVVHGLAAGSGGASTALDARTTDRRAWRAAVPVSESSDRVSVPAGGVTDVFRTASGESGLRYASILLPVPAVASPGGLTTERPETGWQVVDSDGNGLPFRPVQQVGVLPEVLRDGVAMDVRALDRELPGFVLDADWQVWLAPSAPADAVQRLQRAGLAVGSASSVAAREAALSREGPALAFSLLTALAVVAAVLAVLAVAVSAGAAARSRAREAAAMRLIGVPFRTVVRAAVGEQVALLAVAALLAVPAGVLAVALVVPLVRQSATASPVPLQSVPDAVPLAVLLAVYALTVAAMGAFTARAVVGAGDPRRLREVDG